MTGIYWLALVHLEAIESSEKLMAKVDLAPVFPDPSYSQLSARSVMDSERTCAA